MKHSAPRPGERRERESRGPIILTATIDKPNIDTATASGLARSLMREVRRASQVGYRSESIGSAEPSALAAIGLSRINPDGARTLRRFLETLQRRDGSVGSTRSDQSPGWPTAYAMRAWASAGDDAPFLGAIERAARWLIDARGETFEPKPHVYDHDTRIPGWAWVSGTHSWVEPTALAVLALRSCGYESHARVRDGIALLLDRQIESGGWNYGNNRVLGAELHAFPATTGIALCALRGSASRERVAPSLTFLVESSKEPTSVYSAAWTLLGLDAWNAPLPDRDAFVARALASAPIDRTNLAHTALMLIALQGYELLACGSDAEADRR